MVDPVPPGYRDCGERVRNWEKRISEKEDVVEDR